VTVARQSVISPSHPNPCPANPRNFNLFRPSPAKHLFAPPHTLRSRLNRSERTLFSSHGSLITDLWFTLSNAEGSLGPLLRVQRGAQEKRPHGSASFFRLNALLATDPSFTSVSPFPATLPQTKDLNSFSCHTSSNFLISRRGLPVRPARSRSPFITSLFRYLITSFQGASSCPPSRLVPAVLSTTPTSVSFRSLTVAAAACFATRVTIHFVSFTPAPKVN